MYATFGLPRLRPTSVMLTGLMVAWANAMLLAQSDDQATDAPAGRKTAEVRALEVDKFLRLTADENGPRSLDTSIATYRPQSIDSSDTDGVQVDLIGAVHIAEGDYYDELNRLFDDYDVLLYELVAPEGTVIPKGGRRESGGFNPVAMLQDSAKDMLGLQSQLERIDYTKPHFRRADLTPTQLAEKMSERGETALTLALSTLAEVMREQNKPQANAARAQELAGIDMGDVGLFDLFGDPLKMKRVLAAQFASTGSLDQTLGGPLNQLIVVDRNAAALQELQKQIAAGKKKIGIFYGAAHMPDLEQHLIDDFGLRRTELKWLPAWNLTGATREPEPKGPLKLMLDLLNGIE